jgi:DnaJ-domain-containing protein 1
MRLGDHTHGGSRTLQRNAVSVEITLTDGASFFARVFLPMQGRVSDVLNDERQFLPVETDGESLSLAKATIRQVRFPAAANAPYRGKCPYSILGLPEGATVEEIKKAYRELCTANHPDRVRGSGLGQDFVEFATENMMRINSAYAQLTKGVSQKAA